MPAKSADAFRTISEVAEWLGTPTHVLRFWESKFSQVKPVKRAGGRRYYRPADMQLLGGIRKLLHEDGMTIKGVQKILRENGIRYVAAMSPALEDDLDRYIEPTVTEVRRSADHAERPAATETGGDVLPFAARGAAPADAGTSVTSGDMPMPSESQGAGLRGQNPVAEAPKEDAPSPKVASDEDSPTDAYASSPASTAAVKSGSASRMTFSATSDDAGGAPTETETGATGAEQIANPDPAADNHPETVDDGTVERSDPATEITDESEERASEQGSSAGQGFGQNPVPGFLNDPMPTEGSDRPAGEPAYSDPDAPDAAVSKDLFAAHEDPAPEDVTSERRDAGSPNAESIPDTPATEPAPDTVPADPPSRGGRRLTLGAGPAPHPEANTLSEPGADGPTEPAAPAPIAAPELPDDPEDDSPAPPGLLNTLVAFDGPPPPRAALAPLVAQLAALRDTMTAAGAR